MTTKEQPLFPDQVEREDIRVNFRAEKDGEITAVFLNSAPRAGYLTCYAHFGQRDVCAPEWIRRDTVPAKPAEYADLKKELEQIGYNVFVSRRMVYPKPGEIICPKCGRKIRLNKEEYELVCREEDRNAGIGWARMSLEDWAIRNHECKNLKKKSKK